MLLKADWEHSDAGCRCFPLPLGRAAFPDRLDRLDRPGAARRRRVRRDIGRHLGEQATAGPWDGHIKWPPHSISYSSLPTDAFANKLQSGSAFQFPPYARPGRPGAIRASGARGYEIDRVVESERC